MFSMLTLSSSHNDQIDPLGLCTLYLFTICHKTAAHGFHASHAFHIILFELMKKGVPMLPMLSMLFEIIRNAVPCFPCFTMLFEVMKIRSYHAPHAFPYCLKS